MPCRCQTLMGPLVWALTLFGAGLLKGCSQSGSLVGQQYQGVCIFDVDRTLTCGCDCLEEGCRKGHHCYTEQTDAKTGRHKQSNLYRNQAGKRMAARDIRAAVANQDAQCFPAEPGVQSCYDRSYVWNHGWQSAPMVDYTLRISKDVEPVVSMCLAKKFAIAIATNGGSDFTGLQNTCPDWDPKCTRSSACAKSKRCHVVQLLHLDHMDPWLRNDCNGESDFVQHGSNTSKDTMATAILNRLKNTMDPDVTDFKVWFFDDVQHNRRKVIDRQPALASLLGVPVQTCAFAPNAWSSYQSEGEGERGNNLGAGLDLAYIENQVYRQPSWSTATSTGCKGPAAQDQGISLVNAAAKGGVVSV